MGLFDDPNSAALAQLGFGLLQAGGPSRMPVSLGQAFGSAGQGAMDAYRQARADQLERAVSELRMKQLQTAIDSGSLDVTEKRRKLDDAAEARKILQGLYSGGGGIPQSTLPQPSSQPYSPLVTSAFGLPAGAMPPSTQPQGVKPKAQVWQQYQATGDRLASAGLIDQAQIYYDRAEKFRPKLKNEEVRMQGSTPVVVRNYEDGSTEVSPYNPVDKVEYQDIGGGFRPKSGITGAFLPGQDVAKTMTFADKNASARLAFDKDQAGKPQFHDGAWFYRPEKGSPTGAMVVPTGSIAPKGTQQRQEHDAKALLPVLDEADKLVDESTGSYAGAAGDFLGNVVGYSTGGAIAAAKLKVLQGQIMMRQPRMEGPQSDKDVQLYRDMAGQIGDATVPAAQKKAALKEIRILQQKYAGIPMGTNEFAGSIRARADNIIAGGK